MAGSISKTSEETKEAICALYKQGFSYSDIARRVGIGQGLIQKTLKARGVPTRSKAEGIRLWLDREKASGANRGSYDYEEKRKGALKVLKL